MKRKQFSTEQIIRILNEAQLGITVKDLCRKYGISCFLLQDLLAILWCPHERVARIVDRMAHSFDSHAAYYTRLLQHCDPFFTVLPQGASKVGFS